MDDHKLEGAGVKISCDKCDFIDYPWGPPLTCSPGPNKTILVQVYDLQVNKLVPILSEMDWCQSCQRSCNFESIPSDEQITSLLNEYRDFIKRNADDDGESNWSQLLTDLYQKFIKNESIWRDWASKRDSVRCLICGSQNRIKIDFSHPSKLNFPHPGCGGTLEIVREDIDRDNYIYFQWKRIYEHELVLIKFNSDGTKVETPASLTLEERLKKWLSNRKDVLERCEALRKNGGLGANPDPEKVDPEHLDEPLRSMAKKALGVDSPPSTDTQKPAQNIKAVPQNKCDQAIAILDEELPDFSTFIQYIIKRIYETRGSLQGLEAEKVYSDFKNDFDDIAEQIARICLIETYSLNPRRQGYSDVSLHEFSEDFSDIYFMIIEAVRCLITNTMVADVRNVGGVSNEMSRNYNWTSQPTLITSNPFYILGATPEDDSGRIVELADERSLEIEPSKCMKARADLVNPRNRLSAEMRYMPGCSKETIQDLWKKIYSGNMTLLQNPDLPAMTRANLLASAIPLIPPETPPRLRSEWIIDLAYTTASIDLDEVVDDINRDRMAAGFPQVQSMADVENILNELVLEYRDSIKSALNTLSPNDLVDTITYAVSISSKDGETSCPLLIDELVDGYESEARATLQKGAEGILHLIESIKENAVNGSVAIHASVAKLMVSVRNWDRIAQPIQVSHKSRGLDHDVSHKLAWSIRSLAIELFNKHGMLEVAEGLTDLSKEIFAELQEVVGKLKEDSDALEDIYQKRLKEDDDQKAWEEDITYRTELGVIFKDVLAISPKGVQWKDTIYPLENVNRIRWGATNHHTNGVSTGTSYMIVFGNQDGMSIVETRDKLVYDTFINKLWNAVGVRLVTQYLAALEAGKKYSWNGVTIDKNGVKIVIKRLLLSDLEGYSSWRDVLLDHANGCLVVYFKGNAKLHKELSYQKLNNVHVLETVMNFMINQR